MSSTVSDKLPLLDFENDEQKVEDNKKFSNLQEQIRKLRKSQQ